MSLWAANWLFTGSQVHFVQLQIHASRASSLREKVRQGYSLLIGQVALLVVVAGQILLSAFPKLAVLFFSQQDFPSLSIQQPEVGLKVLQLVGGRLPRLVEIIEELLFTTVRHRLPALLVRLAKAEGARLG
jgi:hypothetical protein